MFEQIISLFQKKIMNEDERQRDIRKMRMESDALEDIPYQLFLRLCGLYDTITKEKLNEKGQAELYLKFAELREMITKEINSEDGRSYAKYEMGDYVHNLHLLLVSLLPLETIEANITTIRNEYRNLVGDSGYKEYENSASHRRLIDISEVIKLSRVMPSTGADGVEQAQQSEPVPGGQQSTPQPGQGQNFADTTGAVKPDHTITDYQIAFREEYRILVNENRRLRLFEEHVETTRGYLIRRLGMMFLGLITLPILLVIAYLIQLWICCGKSSNSPCLLDQASSAKAANMTNLAPWAIGEMGIILLCLSAVAGATGAAVSALLRIQGVRDNSQLSQNVVAFKSSEKALRMAPLTGMVFAIALSFIFGGKLIAGSLFPEIKNGDWSSTLLHGTELSKWLIWSFIAGFSERLVPDMIDRLADKARKADEK